MKRKLLRALLIATICFATVVAIAVTWTVLLIPSEKTIKGCLVTKMYQVNLCPGSKDYVPLSRISQHLQRAIVMSEDSSFWTHDGFDWESLEKSAVENWEKGKFKRGGSTITQQLAKNMFLTKDKTLVRKGLEALITMKLEKTLSKKEILERYLNVIEFGRGVFGVKAAARRYFQKTPAALDPVESAFLAMILPSPVKYASSFHKKSLTPFARRRITRILRDMQKTGKISEDEYAASVDRMEWFLVGKPPDPPEPTQDEMGTAVSPDPSLVEELDVSDEESAEEESIESVF